MIRDKAVRIPAGHFRSDAAGDGADAKGKGAMALLGRVWWFECVNKQAIAEWELVAAVVTDICIAALCLGIGARVELHMVATKVDNQVVLRWLEKGWAKRYPTMNKALRLRSQADMAVTKAYVALGENDLTAAGSHADPHAYGVAFERYRLALPDNRPQWWPTGCGFPPCPGFICAAGPTAVAALVQCLGGTNDKGIPVSAQQLADFL